MMAHQATTHRREHLKSKSAKSNREKFVNKLRNDCIARAQQARRLKIQQARQLSSDECPQNGDYTTASSTLAGSSCQNNNNIDVTSCRDGVSSSNKRDREPMHTNNVKASNDNDQYQRMVDHVPMGYSPNIQDIRKISGGVSDEGVLDTAKMLVEHELQRALTGLRHCEQMQQGEPLCKKVYHGSFSDDDNDDEDEEYKISQEEFVALLSEVTEELQREEELLEEELWELERAEALERERLLHEIDDYDDWEELQQQEHQQHSANVYTSPFLTNMSNRVTCPICKSAPLIQTLSGGIECTNAATEKQCPFALDTNHEGLTLNNLSDRLRTVYEEHAHVCQKGVLKFYVDNRGFITTLMARCEECQDEIIVM